ncbi:MAG TPA: hypothetical protein VNZ62_07745 [Capillimicrobium sp.]|nr:hypothetical protein [Capillimicrobium sp.]
MPQSASHAPGPRPHDRVPIALAVELLERARDAGLVHDDDRFASPLRSKLTRLGVRSIAALSPAQALDVAAFVGRLTAPL